MDNAEVTACLTHLAVRRDVAVSTQNQALSSILFLYRDLLELELGSVDATKWLMARLLYVYGYGQMCPSSMQRRGL